ncbi:6-bladed beta-propeller [Gracilimonas sp. Q87]|uniref:6-bladed beta-propeller n=1 Tax=Gracilimonas sp. Q87 TaxID=3384766 RepID=UPI00398409A6
MDYITRKIFTGLLVSVLMITGYGCGSGGDDISAIKKENGVIYNPSVGLLQDEEAPVKIELVETIDLSMIEEPVISNIGYLQIDNDGNFYFIDRRLSKLISLDPEGNLRWATGEEGKGPGDFESPFGISLYKDKLYVANIQGSRLDEFDLSGTFIKTYNLPEDMRFASLVDIREDGLILMSGANFGTVGALVYTMELTDSLRVQDNINIIETEDEEYSRATIRGGIEMRDEDFIYSFNTGYRHQIYDYAGNLKTEVHREFDGILGPGIYANENSVSLYGLGNINSPVFLDSGHYLVQVEHPVNIDDSHAYARRASTGETESPIYEHFMDVYNADHELLYTFEDSDLVEELGSLSVRDYEGYYYSVFSSDLLIKKYRLNTKNEESEMEESDQIPIVN